MNVFHHYGEKSTQSNRESRLMLVMATRPRTRRPVLTPAQLRAARALVGWSRERLAEQTGISNRTIEKFEVGQADLKLQVAAKLRRSLEKAGVVFMDATRDHGPGVVLKDGKLP
jgi:DNA-binding XRE family transcriptional regulator